MATLTQKRAAESADSKSFPDATKVLTDCCEQRTVCRFELVHKGYGASVTMVKLHPQGLELRISKEDGVERLLEQSICCVSFSIGPTFCAFLGHLISVKRPKTGERFIVVSVPKQLTATNLRQSFRVPVIRNSGLETMIRTPDEQQFTVNAIDIAEAGIEIEFEIGDRPTLKVGMVLDVELRFRGEVVQKKSEIRHIAGSKCGLSYINQADESSQRQDARINGFVLTLQQLWLKSRIT